MLKRLCLFLLAYATPQLLHAQVAQSATGSPSHLWVGAGYANYAPDWNIYNLPGIDIYADLSVYRRFGLEGEAQFLNFTQPDGLTEKSLLIGPTATIYQHGRIAASVKVLGGAGFVTYTYGIGYGSYFEFAPRGDVEYRLSRRLKARGGYEYQFMPSAPGLPGYPDHGLTPHGFSLGMAYRIF